MAHATQTSKSCSHLPRTRYGDLSQATQLLIWLNDLERLHVPLWLAQHCPSKTAFENLVGPLLSKEAQTEISPTVDREFWMFVTEVWAAIKKNSALFWDVLHNSTGMDLWCAIYFQVQEGSRSGGVRSPVSEVTYQQMLALCNFRLSDTHYANKAPLHTVMVRSERAMYLCVVRRKDPRHFGDAVQLGYTAAFYTVQPVNTRASVRDGLAFCADVERLDVGECKDRSVEISLKFDLPPDKNWGRVNCPWDPSEDVVPTVPDDFEWRKDVPIFSFEVDEICMYTNGGNADQNRGYDPHTEDGFELVPWILRMIREGYGLPLLPIE